MSHADAILTQLSQMEFVALEAAMQWGNPDAFKQAFDAQKTANAAASDSGKP